MISVLVEWVDRKGYILKGLMWKFTNKLNIMSRLHKQDVVLPSDQERMNQLGELIMRFVLAILTWEKGS